MSSNSITISNAYSETNVKHVMGKIGEDFLAIKARGFDFLESRSSWLQGLKEDLYYIMINKDLKEFQFQFRYNHSEWAVEYKIKDDGSVQADNYSGGVDYWEIPREASITIEVIRHGNPEVWRELQKNGWSISTRGMIEGKVTSMGAYSKGGLSATKKLIGSWEK